MNIPNAFERILAARVWEHKLETTNCSLCPGHSVTTECLPNAACSGQKPLSIILYDGQERLTPAHLFGMRPGSVFLDTVDIVPDPQDLAVSRVQSPFAALAYAAEHLHSVKHFVVMGSSESPTAQKIIRSFAHNEDPSSLFLKRAIPIWDEVMRTVANGHLPEDPQTLMRLTSLELTRRNALHAQAIIGHEKKISALYVEPDEKPGERLVSLLNPAAALGQLFKTKIGRILPVIQQEQEEHQRLPLTMCCSCCDSRAQGIHLFKAQPGEFINSHSVSVIVPPLEGNENHQTWTDIIGAHQKGARHFIVLGHSKCGGIEALLKRARDNESFGPYIDPWLDQAERTARTVLDFAEGKWLSDKQLLELLTKEIKKASAINIAVALGETAEINAYYLEVDTRNVQRLKIPAGDADLCDSVKDTYERMIGQKPVDCLFESPTPANVFSPPLQCPERPDGSARAFDPRYEKFLQLLESAPCG